MKKKNLLFVIFFLLVGASSMFAQQNKAVANLELGNYANDWAIYESMEFVDILYRYSDCSDPANGFYPEFILFKVVNKTKNDVYVYWEYEAEYGNVESKASPNENLVQVKLKSLESIEGNCDNFYKTKLGIFVRLKNHGDAISDFKFTELKEYKLN
jgi:hypothetical protein